MTTNAISRHGDGKTASFKLDDYGAEGVCEYDLATRTLVLKRGTLGSLNSEGLLYRIWRQMQDVKWSEARCLKEWQTFCSK